MSDSPQANHEPRHDSLTRRFELDVEGQQAYATYQLAGKRMIIDYTYAPPALRGTGVAGRVVRAALEEARKQGWRVEPRCSYVAVWMSRHPEYQALLAE